MNGILSNLHTHTNFSDGTSTPEQHVKAALDLGFRSIGFSDHAYAPYDVAYDLGGCMEPDAMPAYTAHLGELREKYCGQIEIYIGLEGDYYNMPSREGLDYLIGSVHHLRDDKTGVYYGVDNPGESLVYAAKMFGGDMREVVRLYYALVADMAENVKPEILGHIDLLTKLNGGNRFFDSTSGWYLDITARAVDAVKRSGCVVEVNTGGMARGYTTQPYPEKPVMEQIFAAGIPVTISSDAHCAENLTAEFDAAAKLLREVGYRSTAQLIGGKFVEVEL